MTTSVDPKVQKLLKQEEQKLEDFIFNEYFASNIKASPLKSAEAVTAETRAKIREKIQWLEKNVEKSIQLFNHAAHNPKERQHVEEVFSKCRAEAQSVLLKGEVSDSAHIGVKDVDFLVTLAKKELAAGRFEDASKMFALLVQLFPAYSPTWIGWAISEMRWGDQTAATAIYDTALVLLPKDLLLAFYAARFYGISNKKKAVEVLQAGLKVPKEAGEDTHLVRDAMNKLLKQLKHS